jgi:1-acyl-sn-glycerol-3-phosphate acyltransferase
MQKMPAVVRAPVSGLVDVLRGGPSFFAATLVGLDWLVLDLFLRLVVIPGAWLFPRHRLRLVTWHMKAISWTTFAIFRIGGGRFRRKGVLPTGAPAYVVANHQAVLDIMQVTLLARPYAPAFVTRTRYQRFIPQVSACIRLLGCPMVDPKSDRLGAIEAIRRGVRELTHGLLIFPEGHRSRDGEVGRFRTAGLEVMLRERRLPVYVVINDGMWRARRFTDAIFRAHLMDGWSEVVGRFDPPEEDAEIPAFIDRLRNVIVERLAAHRAGNSPQASSGRGPGPEAPARRSDAG